MPIQNSKQDNAYYAVRSDLVLAARDHFGIRSSDLDAGEKRLLLKAQAIARGDDQDRWGHHKGIVIQKFCEFTVSAGSRPLSWWDLVEDESIYDSKEGVSSRTGNRPLGTVQRCNVDPVALSQALEKSGGRLDGWAERLELPQALVQALLDGQWASVSAPTADKLRNVLGDDALRPIQEVRIDGNSTSKDGLVVCDGEVTSQRPRFHRTRWVVAGLGVLVFTVLIIVWSSKNDHGLAESETVGYWNYDNQDGQLLEAGLILIPQPGRGVGASWQFQLELTNHASLPVRERQLWPVELYRSTRKVCINYPDYPSYTAFIDMPDVDDDGTYSFGRCP